jgi:hypothetical protein
MRRHDVNLYQRPGAKVSRVSKSVLTSTVLDLNKILAPGK